MATVVIETAQPLFHGMIISIFWAAVSFFDTTPSSRILNRVIIKIKRNLRCMFFGDGWHSLYCSGVDYLQDCSLYQI
ncbi:putative ABC transporter C family member [Trifolium repens]|nr:putative ABC transporter C family member [Trifolium repens]